MPIKYVIFLLPLLACNPQVKEETIASGNINSGAPYIWANRTFPKTLQISQAFTDVEVANFTEMGDAWKTSLENKRTFFNMTSRTPEITNSISSLDSMLDGVMGIYKTTHWPPSLPGSALAVTQIFGRRYNVGSPSEFVNIEHADILVNYDIHRFDTSDLPGSNYDLRTVMLHELGHFLGLTHKSSISDPSASVMYPTVRAGIAKRDPRPVDINDLATKYGITLSSGAAPAAMKGPKYEIDPRNAGEHVKLIIELHADGSCVHKENGKIISRHQVSLQR